MGFKSCVVAILTIVISPRPSGTGCMIFLDYNVRTVKCHIYKHSSSYFESGVVTSVVGQQLLLLQRSAEVIFLCGHCTFWLNLLQRLHCCLIFWTLKATKTCILIINLKNVLVPVPDSSNEWLTSWPKHDVKEESYVNVQNFIYKASRVPLSYL